MKKFFLCFLLIFIFTGAKAQVLDEYGAVGYGFLWTKPKTFDKVEGSPYLDENFRKSEIVFEGKKPLHVYTRYNVLDEEMEVKVEIEDVDIFTLSSEKKPVYKIGDRKYYRDEIFFENEKISGFFGELYASPSVKLLIKTSASITEPIAAKSNYDSEKPPRIKMDENYYVVFEDGKVEKVSLRKRDLKKVFSSKEAKNYLSDNKIKSEEDLIAFIKFYDSL